MNAEPATISAVVRAIEGDDVLVQVEHGGCGRCHEKGGCGGQQITQMFCSGPKQYRVRNPGDAVVGEQVIVAIAPGAVRQTANLVYGVPLTATIFGALAGTQFFGDTGGMIGAAIGLMFSVGYVRFRSLSPAGKIAVQPYIISRS
jgi:sigma-E factor negative regulatory protein RseC